MARILVCEPSDDVRGLLVLLLRRLGHEPVVPGEGDEGQVDLVLGEPAEAAASLARAPGVPLLGLSIYPLEDALVAPAAFLPKPFTAAALAEAVTLALGSAGA